MVGVAINSSVQEDCQQDRNEMRTRKSFDEQVSGTWWLQKITNRQRSLFVLAPTDKACPHGEASHLLQLTVAVQAATKPARIQS